MCFSTIEEKMGSLLKKKKKIAFLSGSFGFSQTSLILLNEIY